MVWGPLPAKYAFSARINEPWQTFHATAKHADWKLAVCVCAACKAIERQAENQDPVICRQQYQLRRAARAARLLMPVNASSCRRGRKQVKTSFCVWEWKKRALPIHRPCCVHLVGFLLLLPARLECAGESAIRHVRLPSFALEPRGGRTPKRQIPSDC